MNVVFKGVFYSFDLCLISTMYGFDILLRIHIENFLRPRLIGISDDICERIINNDNITLSKI